MFRNYLKTAWRFVKQNKIFAGINVLGLSIALAASFIILLYVINELSYNNCHTNRKQVYRVLNYYVDFNNLQAGTPYILAKTLEDDFPQVEKVVNEKPVSLKLKQNDEFIQVYQAIATDSEIFDIFTIPFIWGTAQNNLLDEKNAIVLSREVAEKLFGNINPVGKEVVGQINKEEQIFIVKAVFENLPPNSTFKAKCFVNGKWTINDINRSFRATDADVSWNYNFWRTWVLLSNDSKVADLESQFRALEKKNMGDKPNYNYSLQNLSDVYLGSDQVLNTGMKGNMSNIKLFLAIAVLILLVASFNFIILSTAVSTGRAKEIGIRKTNGAGIHSIRNQLLIESMFLTLLVLPIALTMAWFSKSYAGSLFQTKLEIWDSNLSAYFIVYLSLTILIGFVSGIYTSYYLSKLSVISILKNNIRKGKSKPYFRSAMIVVQLIIFCSFVSGTLIIRSQYQYALNKDPGYHPKDIILVDVKDCAGYASFLNSIRSNPNVIMAAGVMEGLPMQGSMSTMYPHFQDKEQKVYVEGLAIDYGFLKTMGIPVIEGRDFSEEFGSDLKQSVILNESAVKQLGISDPLGKKLGYQTIIGVVKDFNLHSIHTEIPPLSISLTDRYIRQVAVHYKQGTIGSLVHALESEWKKIEPDRPFSYMSIEDLIQSLYASEKNLSTIVSIFALFTLLIAALGLFGLTLFVARTRTKEVGIKKVFGSSEKIIIYSFLKGNFLLVVIASFISIPVTIFFMVRWLNKFPYHTTISWWVFAIAFVISTVVVLSTVLYHSFRAARTNPVKALRYE